MSTKPIQFIDAYMRYLLNFIKTITMKKLTNHISFLKNAIFLFALLVMILGCQRNDDPFKDSKIGNTDIEIFQMQLAKQGLIEEPYNDSSDYRYYILNGKRKFPVEISFNSGVYKFGKLRDIYINLLS